jgi:RNA polymerase primary sigma factor
MSKDYDKSKFLKAMPENLTAREAKILKMRFGVDFKSSPKFKEIGKQFDVTRERIRKIEKKVLRKLKHRDGDDDPDAA